MKNQYNNTAVLYRRQYHIQGNFLQVRIRKSEVGSPKTEVRSQKYYSLTLNASFVLYFGLPSADSRLKIKFCHIKFPRIFAPQLKE